VHKLRGTVDVSTKESKGTSFELDLPLTLAATLAVVVKIGNNITAIPYEPVERILRLTAQDLGTVANKTVILVNQEQVPFSSIAQVLGLNSDRALSSEKPQPALLIKLGEQRIVFAVDEIVGQYEVVVQSLGKRLAQHPLLAGTAVLDSGEVVSVLNPAELIRLAKPLVQKKADDSRHSRILVVDDSLTTRSAMKAVLEIAGYQVVPATDGEEALNLLKRTPFDLVVTDVQMPRMDGLTLTRQVKSDPAITNVPVIVVTSLDTNSDRAAGLEAGADGYLVKRDVERGKLLDLVRQLLPG
jgi:two-component system chemotaxis sensor kinase CheA